MQDIQEDKLNELIQKSNQNDLNVLLSAKNQAQRAVLEDSSSSNLEALKKATAMLDQASSSVSELKTWVQVLEYIKESCGCKLGKTKLFEDIKKGLLKKRGRDGFKRKDVDIYAASLPMLAGTSDLVADKARERQVRKEEEEIRRIKAIADKEEFLLKVRKGEYIARAQVYLELAGRAMALSTLLKTNFKARILELVEAAGGKPKKGLALLELLEVMFDEALHEYAKELDFELLLEFEAVENSAESERD